MKVTLVPATAEDAQFLLDLRNDQDAREMSLHTGKVKPSEHRSWLSDTLSRDDRVLYIVVVEDRKVGMVRTDLDNEVAHLSVNILQRERGKGLARLALEAMIAAHSKDVRLFEAVVNCANAASLKLFTKIGFAKHSTDDGFVTLRKEV